MQLDYRTALQGLVKVSSTMQLEFLQKHNGKKDVTPLKYVTAMFRRDAIEALAALVDVSPENPAEIRALQDTIKRHIATIEKIKVTLDGGDDAWTQLDAEEQAELAEIIEQRQEGGEAE